MKESTANSVFNPISHDCMHTGSCFSICITNRLTLVSSMTLQTRGGWKKKKTKRKEEEKKRQIMYIYNKRQNQAGWLWCLLRLRKCFNTPVWEQLDRLTGAFQQTLTKHSQVQIENQTHSLSFHPQYPALHTAHFCFMCRVWYHKGTTQKPDW